MFCLLLLLLLLKIFFGNVNDVFIAGTLLELEVQFNHAAVAGVGYESLDVVIRTSRRRQRVSVLVDVRVLLEMIDRDSVDVNRGFGVSAAASGSVASLTIVETVGVVAIAIVGQLGRCTGSKNGCVGGGCFSDAGNQMIDATSVRPLMLEKLLRCRHVRIRADSYGCV